MLAAWQEKYKKAGVWGLAWFSPRQTPPMKFTYYYDVVIGSLAYPLPRLL